MHTFSMICATLATLSMHSNTVACSLQFAFLLYNYYIIQIGYTVELRLTDTPQ